MMKNLLIGIMCVGGFAAQAQVQTPSPSPAGSTTAMVGLTEIKIEYYRPGVKGRKIFSSDPSALVPYGSIWRTGANSGTKISFSTDVKVEGVAVSKGEYLMYTWPGETDWVISLYSDLSLGGQINKYDRTKEVMRFKGKATKLAEKVETLTFTIGDIAPDSKSAKVQLAWDNTAVKFTVTVDYDAQVMASIKESTNVNPNNYFGAAVYYLETGRDLKQALTWINMAAESNPGAFWILHQKAKIQKGLGDKAGATATANASLEAAKKAENRDYQKMNQDLIASMK